MPRFNFIFYAAAAIVFIADQASKVIVKSTFALGESVSLLPFFSFTYVENRGIAFSLLQKGGDMKQYFLIAMTLLAIGVMLYMFYSMKEVKPGKVLILACITGGAAGNLYDRVFRGAVIDFLDLHAAGFHWPVFNIADSFISVCIALIFYRQVFRKEQFF